MLHYSLRFMIVGLAIAFVRENLIVRSYLYQDFHPAMPFMQTAVYKWPLIAVSLFAGILAYHTFAQILNSGFGFHRLADRATLVRYVVGGLALGLIHTVCVVLPTSIFLPGVMTRWGAALLPQLESGPPAVIGVCIVVSATIGGIFLFLWFSREAADGPTGADESIGWNPRGGMKSLAPTAKRGALAGSISGGFVLIWYIMDIFFNGLVVRAHFAPTWSHFFWVAPAAILTAVAVGAVFLVAGDLNAGFLSRLRGGGVPLLILSIFVGAGISVHEYAALRLDFGKDPDQFIMSNTAAPVKNTIVVMGKKGFYVHRVSNGFPDGLWTERFVDFTLPLLAEDAEMAKIYMEQKDYKTSMRRPMLIYQMLESDYNWTFYKSLNILKTYTEKAECTACLDKIVARASLLSPSKKTREHADFAAESKSYVPSQSARRRISLMYAHLGDAAAAAEWASLRGEFPSKRKEPSFQKPPVATGNGVVRGCLRLDGLPLPHMRVALAATDDRRLLFIDNVFEGRFFIAVARTDTNGCFRFNHLTNDNDMYLIVRDAEGFIPTSTGAMRVNGNPGRLHLSADAMKIDLGRINMIPIYR